MSHQLYFFNSNGDIELIVYIEKSKVVNLRAFKDKKEELVSSFFVTDRINQSKLNHLTLRFDLVKDNDNSWYGYQLDNLNGWSQIPEKERNKIKGQKTKFLNYKNDET